MKQYDVSTSVLVVDDEQDIRDGCERILSRIGCEVNKAVSGEDALEMVTANPEAYALILLDLKMPGIDGIEVLSRVLEINKEILVIIITGYATVETAIDAMKKGAYDFISKPFEPAHLRIVIERAREKIRLLTEAQELKQEQLRTLSDLDTEKSRNRAIIDSLPNGVLVTNADGQVVLMNPISKKYLNLNDARPAKGHLSEFVTDEGLFQLIMDISQGKSEERGEVHAYEYALPEEKYILAQAHEITGEEGECLGALVNLTDITALKVLDRLKSEFVAKVSHELRSPLSTIHEQLATVLKEISGDVDETEQRMLSRAKEKTQGLISLIGDLLDISRIESGNECVNPKPVQLNELLMSIVDFLNAKAKAKNQSLTMAEPSAQIPPILADPLALESIFGNLITNAIHYTPDGGEIHVTIAFEDGHLRVAVKDNGYGIEPRHHEKIFDKFYRVKDENTRFITGTGLGLPIVKGLVDSLNGTIRIESDKGQGATFIVRLPVN